MITGVFCNEAISAAENDTDNLIRQELSRSASAVNCFKRVFAEADIKHDGCIPWWEFEQHQNDERVQAMCRSLELEITDAEMLFEAPQEGESLDLVGFEPVFQESILSSRFVACHLVFSLSSGS